MEARAKFIWGEPSSKVMAYLQENGVSDKDALALLAELREERAGEIRQAGLKKILLGGLLMLLPIAYYVIATAKDNVMLKLFAALIFTGVFGLWTLSKGFSMVLLPQSATDDLSSGKNHMKTPMSVIVSAVWAMIVLAFCYSMYSHLGQLQSAQEKKEKSYAELSARIAELDNRAKMAEETVALERQNAKDLIALRKQTQEAVTLIDSMINELRAEIKTRPGPSKTPNQPPAPTAVTPPAEPETRRP